LIAIGLLSRRLARLYLQEHFGCGRYQLLSMDRRADYRRIVFIEWIIRAVA
jgi:hypothetical protein